MHRCTLYSTVVERRSGRGEHCIHYFQLLLSVHIRTVHRIFTMLVYPQAEKKAVNQRLPTNVNRAQMHSSIVVDTISILHIAEEDTNTHTTTNYSV